MTRILKMEMKGFKSFATKTEVVFGETFNCILGPNGSGKSNVLDSLCFVLGKAGAKGLRVEKSSNLIYNGGKTKKPAKEGEVSIWFDNSENTFPSISEKEVKITRIIKSNGQGVYKINDQTSTRTQILDVLGLANINPDGYNIILQGDIVRLIEMSPSDRRQIIEEIAGINIYEDKKNKAVRELNRVEEKLNEADIILTERESYLKELKKDRDKAQKYKDLEESRKRNKKTLLVQDIEKRQKELSSIQEKQSSLESSVEEFESSTATLREEISEKKKEIKEINKEVEEKGEKEQVEMHKIIEDMKVSLAVDNQRLQTVQSEIEKLKNRQQELQESQQELQGKTKHLAAKKEELEKRIAIRKEDKASLQEKIIEFKKKNNLDVESSTDQEIEAIDTELDTIQKDMNDLRERQQEVLREKDRVEMKLQSIDDRLEKMASVQEEHKKELEQLKHKKQEFKKTTLELNKTLSQSSEYASQLATARSKSLSKQEELARLEARRASILEQSAGSDAVKFILQHKKHEKGILGTVAELGSVASEYATAFEIAAGNKAKSVVVENDTVAARCIALLKEKRLGVATFLPLNKIRHPPLREELRKLKKAGVRGLAIDLMKFDKKFEPIFKYVFGNTLVVDTIDHARSVGIGSTRMVTLQGDLVESSGAMQGGFRQQKRPGTGLFGQEEINSQIEAVSSELQDLETVVARLEQQSQDAHQLIDRLRSLKAELEGDIIKTEKSLHLDGDDAFLEADEKKKLQEKNNELEDAVDEIQDEIREKNTRFAQLKISRQQLRDKLTDLRNPRKLAELQSFEEKQLELSQEIVELEGQLKHSITEMETIIGPEERKILEIVKQQEKELSSFTQEQVDLQEKINKETVALEEKEKLQKQFYEQFQDLFKRRSNLSDEVSEREISISKITTQQREVEHKINALHLDQARLKAELSGLEKESEEFATVQPYEDKPRDLIKRELAQFDRMTQDLGAVNMRALEIYEDVQTEYNSLLEKKETLRKEREDVLVMMNEIDSKKKELFMKTFKALETNFQRIFSTLLMKGDASIVLENENDPFEGGVEIKVRLTGKRFMDIRSLSGGEKTMTALAFLFAVQEYEPASFYVLDEVDAALDKKNSEKLAQLIRGYCDHAQYVVISHNDGVISEADNLYGVSMNEHGMSKVTTLKI